MTSEIVHLQQILYAVSLYVISNFKYPCQQEDSEQSSQPMMQLWLRYFE